MESDYEFGKTMKEFEKQIVDFLLFDAISNGGNPDLTAIYLNVLLHSKLTQQQLTELTGFPKSKVSKLTQIMVTKKILQRTFLPGTHTNIYYLVDEPFEINHIPRESIRYGYIRQESYLQNIIEKIDQLPPPDPAKASGRKIILYRVIEFLEYIQLCKAILDYHEQSEDLSQFQFPSTLSLTHLLSPKDVNEIRQYLTNQNQDVYLLYPFDDPIIAIEKEVIDFLLEGIIREDRKSEQLILVYFITRGKLTQKEIQTLTQLSAGTVSQILNQMIEDKAIVQLHINKAISNEYFYTMESISHMMFSRNINLLSQLLEWKPQFLRMKSRLNAQNNRLLLEPGYFAIYSIIDKILTVFIPRYERNLAENQRLFELWQQRIQEEQMTGKEEL